MDFCPITLELLTPITSDGTLKFKSEKTGTVYDANDENTLLSSGGTTDSVELKYKNVINFAAYDPTNPRVRLSSGCEKCGRKVLTMQRIGIDKKVIYSCYCSHQFSLI